MQRCQEEEDGSAVTTAAGSTQKGDAGADAGGFPEGGGPDAEQALEPQLSGRSSLTPHYDPARDVVLRYDVLSSRAVKVGGVKQGRLGSCCQPTLPVWHCRHAWMLLHMLRMIVIT